MLNEAMPARRMRPWSTGDQPSFAHDTFAVRIPKILDDTVEKNGDLFSAAVRKNLAALRSEITGGALRGLEEQTADRETWDRACAPHVGRSWLDIPWYFGESLFYRRILEATHYFSDRAGLDPFLVVKHQEEQTGIPRAAHFLQACLNDISASSSDGLDAALLASLWGNRADLSYTAGLAHGSFGGSDDLLVDERPLALAKIRSSRRVGIVLDNAGTELAFDLVLAELMTRAGIEVALYAKSHPFFVSDATAVDVERTRVALGVPALRVISDPFMASSAFLFSDEIPLDLTSSLANQGVVVLKGDANYRRLVGDAPWSHDTPFSDVTDFPVACVALRTCKAEVAVGISDDVASRAQQRDPRWLTSGRFGMIQCAHCSATDYGRAGSR